MSTPDSVSSTSALVILLVDDEPEILQWLSRPLLEAGFRIIFAPNGREALDAVRRERPDLALIDLMMPKMDGFEVVKVLKEGPATADIPVGIMQSLPADYPWYPYPAISGRGEIFQADYIELVVTKPLLEDLAELVIALQQWFAKRVPFRTE